MPLSDAELQALRFVPNLATDPVDQEKEGIFKDEGLARWGQLPYSYTGTAGQVVTVKDDASGISVASQAGTGLVSFGFRPVSQFRPWPVLVTASRALTDFLHCGARIKCKNTSAITLTLSLSGDPLSGVVDNFVCQIARMKDAAAVQLAFGGGLINAHPSLHTRVGAQRIIEVWVIDGQVNIYGVTDP